MFLAKKVVKNTNAKIITSTISAFTRGFHDPRRHEIIQVI